jgi:hypothetical protein
MMNKPVSGQDVLIQKKIRGLEFLIPSILIMVSLSVYLYLFGFADRKIYFLYGHLGLQPFDEMTMGRYWMTGLVLSGYLSVLYLLVRLIILFIIKSNNLSWITTIKLSALPLIFGILWITMTMGKPVMPFNIAFSSALALIIGTAIGCSVVDDVINDYKSTCIYILFAVGLIPFLTLFRVIELPDKGLLSVNVSVLVIISVLLIACIWLLLLYRIFKKFRPKFFNIIKGTLAIAYVGLPVIHHLLATPKGIPYITTADNFFAAHIWIRMVNWAILILLVYGFDKLSKKNTHRLS